MYVAQCVTDKRSDHLSHFDLAEIFKSLLSPLHVLQPKLGKVFLHDMIKCIISLM